MTYYFIVYQWRRVVGSMPNWMVDDDIINIHPIEWLIKHRNYPPEIWGTKEVYSRFNLLWWTEISDELAEKYKEDF